MKTGSKELERVRTLQQMEVNLDRILTTMYEQPSYYTDVLSKVREAKSIIRKNLPKASDMVREALDMAEEESSIAMEFSRKMNAIAPDDPVLAEKKVVAAKDEYLNDIRSGRLKVARKSLQKLDSAIGGRGRPPALTAKIETANISKDNTVRLTITNVDRTDVVINAIYCSSNIWRKDVLVEVPVIRGGNSIQVPIELGDGLSDTAVMLITVSYTRDLVPVRQKFSFKIFGEEHGAAMRSRGNG